MKKGIVLVIVLGVMFVIFTLSFTIIYFMAQQARIAEHKIRRMRTFYAAQAGMVHALETIRKDPDVTFPLTLSSIGMRTTEEGFMGYPYGGMTVTMNKNTAAGPGGEDAIIATVSTY